MFESKQFRKEKKIFKALTKKFEKAFLIEFKRTATADTFTIDNKFIIVFENSKLIVSRQDTSEKLVSIDCTWCSDNSESQTRADMFGRFLRFATKKYDDFVIKQADIKKQQKVIQAARDAKEQKRLYMNKLNKTLSKLK